MEQHPVPQNVTTFQFRLIGDMTIKQFSSLAIGLVLAFICYKLPLPFFFTWPLTALFAFLGVGFAFIPIEERPMDVWVLSFFKSVYNPTLYIWKKAPTMARVQQQVPPPRVTAAPVAAQQPAPKTDSRLAHMFHAHTQPPAPAPKAVQISPAKPEHSQPALSRQPRILSSASKKFRQSFTDVLSLWFSGLFRTPASTTIPKPTVYSSGQPAMPQHMQKVQQAQPPSVSQDKLQLLEKELAGLQIELKTKQVTEERIDELQKQIVNLIAEKNTLSEELAMLKQNPAPPPASIQFAAPSTTKTAQPLPPKGATQGIASSPTTSIHVIPKGGSVNAGLPRLTSTPNVITGIVRDNNGNLLPNVLVTVRDQGGIPLRALKTNKLGQFGASTPLANGAYLLEVEDPRKQYVFDRAHITLSGAVLPPLEIIAKSQKELNRAKLEQQIFGAPNI